ncbi:hypothetical protein MRB53_038103 [Persea americana]|nr:hypothetical protein MRB53_038103 [Persea americana]
MTLASWDTETGQRIRRHIGHEEVINSMDISKRGMETLASASDDGYIGVGRGTRLRKIWLMLASYGTQDRRKP